MPYSSVSDPARAVSDDLIYRLSSRGARQSRPDEMEPYSQAEPIRVCLATYFDRSRDHSILRQDRR